MARQKKRVYGDLRPSSPVVRLVTVMRNVHTALHQGEDELIGELGIAGRYVEETEAEGDMSEELHAGVAIVEKFLKIRERDMRGRNEMMGMMMVV